MGRMLLKLTLLFATIFSTTITSFAQQNGNIDIVDYLSLDKEKDAQLKNLNLIRAKSLVDSFDPVDEIWNKTPWNDPKINFTPHGAFINIGDVNGDGVDDMVKQFSSPDERDNDISTTVNKSLLFYGGTSLSPEYDEIVYTTVYPLGDLNGDGFADAVGEAIDGEATLYQGSASGLTSVSSTQANFLLSIQKRSLTFLAGQDLNGDNFEDIFGSFSNQDDGKTKYFEILGAATFETISYTETILPPTTISKPSNLYRFVKNDTVHVGVNAGNPQTGEVEFRVFKYVNPDSIALAEVKIVPGGPLIPNSSMVSDFDGDGPLDLIVQTVFDGTYFFKGLSVSDSIFAEPIQITNTFESISKKPSLLGDITGDSRGEILFHNTQNIEVINYDSLTNSLVSIKSFTSSEILPSSDFSLGVNTENSIFIPGFNTFSLPIFSREKFGNVVFKSQNGSNTFEAELITQNTADFSIKFRRRLFHLSDLKGNGTDNFAIFQSMNGESQLLIMNGFNDQSPGVIEIENPDTLDFSFVQAGYFNSTDNKSIAVLLKAQNQNEHQSEIRFYSLSDLVTPYHVIRQTELSPALNKLELMANLGDINNDGFDDLGIAVPTSNEQEKVFILLGGTTISSSPEITLDLNAQFPDPTGGSTNWGATVIQGIGDLNDDGIDDFVIGDPGRFYSSRLAEVNPFISGVIYVLYGQNTALPSFTGPDLELLPDTSNITNRQRLFGGVNNIASGDFDGDGKKDIAAKALRHANEAFDEGVGALSYFFGKNGFTGQPDTTIPIRSEYVFTPNTVGEETYIKASGRALLKAVADLNEDGADELLFVPGSGFRNAVLYEIGDSPTDLATVIYNSPNANLPLHPSPAFLNVQYFPLVGDYNGDGRLNFLGYQPSDRNYRDTPIYLYELDNMAVSNEDEELSTPSTFNLEQNYPNPFNPTTTISFSLPTSSQITIDVFNMLGQKVSTMVNQRFAEGRHSIQFNASNLASGIYIYRIKAGNLSSVKRMTLIK